MRFTHTFFFDGAEDEDYLKGMGIRFETVLAGKSYDRHIRFETDQNIFHEAATLLNSSHPRLPAERLENQMNGVFQESTANQDVETARAGLPIWDRYSMLQDSAEHYRIQKQTKPQCCALTCQNGRRAPGIMAVTGIEGGIMLGIQDFWQKYPAGLEADGLNQEMTGCTAWFYSPEAEGYDFRHYATEGYQETSYEGFPEMGACAVGIGVTCECRLELTEALVSEEELLRFSKEVQKPPVYVLSPQTYYEKRAFGYWSLPSRETPVEDWLETQLEAIFDFYKKEVDARGWYGRCGRSCFRLWQRKETYPASAAAYMRKRTESLRR